MKYFLLVLIACSTCYGARIVEPCDMLFTVQDGDIGENLVVEIVFDNKSIKAEKSSFFEPKKAKLQVGEGIHTLKWRVRKRDFGKESEVYDWIEKKIEIERRDTVCYVFIKGRSVYLNSNAGMQDKG